jgi:glycosyl transferase family 25
VREKRYFWDGRFSQFGKVNRPEMNFNILIFIVRMLLSAGGLRVARALDFNHLFDHLFIISMKSHERWKLMKELIELLGVQNNEYTVVGINGSEVASNKTHSLRKFIGNAFLDSYSEGELGCALSHRAVYDIVSRKNYNHALVIEDDAKLSPDFLRVVQRYREYIASTWMIVHWHSFCNDKAMTSLECGGNIVQNYTSIGRVQVVGHLYTSIKRQEYYGTVAYEINSLSAKKLLERTTPITCASDGPTSSFGLNKPFEDYVQTYVPLVYQAVVGYSEINKLGGHGAHPKLKK